MTEPRRTTRAAAFWLLLPLLGFAGCGGSGLSKTEETSSEHLELRDIAEVYRVYSINNKRPPKKLSELSALETFGANGLNAAREGRLVVRMEAALPDTNEEPGKGDSPEVLAYPAAVPQDGGYVLMLDRSIRKMTPDEFKAAPKAGVEAPAETKSAKGKAK